MTSYERFSVEANTIKYDQIWTLYLLEYRYILTFPYPLTFSGFYSQYILGQEAFKIAFNYIEMFGIFYSFMAGLGRNRIHIALSKWSMVQFRADQQTRQQPLRAYCPNYTVAVHTQKFKCHGIHSSQPSLGIDWRNVNF